MDHVFNKLRKDFGSKKVLIFGLGLLGRGIGDTKLFCRLGSSVKVTDLKTRDELAPALNQLKRYPVTYTLGGHKKDDIEWADVIIRNASVPWHHPLLELARHNHTPIYMDTQLFVQYAQIMTIGITGTRGKTTTTQMIFSVLKDHLSKQVLLGGNVSGIATLPLIEKITRPADTIAVLELSSWQLQAFDHHRISPQIAVLTNIYPDHLNTYSSMSQYIDDKKAIITHQSPSDHVFVNAHHRSQFSTWQNVAKSQLHWYDTSQLPESIRLKLKGDHNLQNAAAAYAVAIHMGISADQAVSTLNRFKPVPFRLQQIATINHIPIYNDTTSTTPAATIAAINSFDQPVTLIMGGTDKKLPLDDLIKNINQKVDHLILIQGDGTERIIPHLRPKFSRKTTDSLKQAVTAAIKHTPPNGTIVFSPGFTSFGLFQNEFDRGIKFNQAVASIK